METVLAICLGLGLSAACGFRVFVPLLGISVAALAGHLELAASFRWIGTWPALACFLTATVLEVSAYYVPWVDNLLDTIATPAAVVAGTMATASVVTDMSPLLRSLSTFTGLGSSATSVVTDMSPLLRWSLAIIAGGGVAAVVQTGTVTLRGASTATTGGLANFAVSTGELALSTGMTFFAFMLPILAAVCVLVFVALAVRIYLKRRTRIALAGKSPVAS